MISPNRDPHNPAWFVFPILLIVLSPVAADQINSGKAGRVSEAFLQVVPGARMGALGGLQAAAEGDTESSFSNPAGIASLQTPQFSLYHNESFIESKYSSLGFGLPIKKSVFSFNGQYTDHGSDEKVGIDSSNQPVNGLGSFRYSNTLVNLAWARRMGDRIPVGIALKGWNEERANSSQRGWAADAGLQLPVTRSLDLGFAGRNLGPRQEGYDLPTTYALGAAYHFRSQKSASKQTTLFSELSTGKNQKTVYRGGLEMQWSGFWLRSGYENLSSNLEDPLANYSVGGGVRIKGWKVDYAWTPKGDLGNQQLLTLTFAMGLTAEEREKLAKNVDDAIKQRVRGHAEEELSQGRLALKTGDWTSASDRFTKTLLWDPLNKEALDSLKLVENKVAVEKANQQYQEGEDAYSNGQWMDAAFHWNQAVQLVPSHEEALKGLKRAQKKLNENVKVARTDAELERAFNAGVGFYLEGKHREALKEWRSVEKKNPHMPYLREYMEKAKNKLLELEVAELKDKGTKPRGDVESLTHQAYMLFNLGQDAKAIDTWRRVLALDPANKDAKEALTQALEKQKLVNNAAPQRQIREVEKLNIDAMNVYLEGDLEKAASLWRQAVRLDPTDVRVKNNLKRAEVELALKGGNQ